MLLAFAAVADLGCEIMDFITAFLNGDLNEEIHMVIPQGLRSSKTEGIVCKLLKSVYGLKQSP